MHYRANIPLVTAKLCIFIYIYLMNPQEQYNKEAMAFQEANIFPAELMPSWFGERAKIALQFHCPSQLKVSITDFKRLYNKSGGYNLFDMGILLNIMEGKSIKNLEMEFDEYVAYQTDLAQMSTKWLEIMNPELERLQRKYQTMQALTGQKGKTMALGKA